MRKLALVIALSLTPILLAQNGLITTVAGNGTNGTSGVGGFAINASLSAGAVCVDSADNFYIADYQNNRVLKVNGATGILTLVAGTGKASSTGDGGPALQATVNAPFGVALDSSGNLFIAEQGGNRVRRVDAASQVITTVAGTGTAGFSGDGGPAVSAKLNRPYGITLDASGNLYIADPGNYRIRRVDGTTGLLSTVAGNGSSAHSPDGTPATSAGLAVPIAVSVDQQGDLFIIEMLASVVREVSAASGLLSTVAGNGGTTFNGDGGPATSAALGYVLGNVVWDGAGNFYFGDGTGRIRKVDANGIITTVAGNGDGAHGAIESGGSGGGGPLPCPSGLGDNGSATIATIDGASGLAFDTHGNLLIADWIDCRVRSVSLPSPLLYTNTTISVNGQTLTATVTPIDGGATPTGTLEFLNYQYYGPSAPLASAPLVGGTATLNLNQIPNGYYTVLAIYQGDGTYNGSGSTTISAHSTAPVAIIQATYGNSPMVSTPVNITFTTSGSAGLPTGTLQLSEGSAALGTVTLVNGTAQYTYTSSIPGTHTIGVQYSGDSTYLPRTWSLTLALLVPGSVTVTANNNPAPAGANVTFTATLAASTATGAVIFYSDGGSLGSQYLANGTASLTTATLPVGTHSITVSYGGDYSVAPATSSPYTETIVTPTSVALTTNASPSTWNQSLILTATISPAAAAGSINFYDSTTLLGTTTLTAGTASLTTSQLAAGTHSLTAVYVTSGSYGGSTSPAVAQTVSKATPVLTLSSSANSVVSPATVTFTASVNPADAGATVQFLDGQTVLGTSAVSAGSATFSSSSLTPGTHTITAVAQADTNLNQSTSPALTQTIQSTTAIALSAASGTTVFGQAVTFTATLTPTAATGAVQFSDGGAAVGTATLVNGAAILTLPSLSAGTHSIQAAYNGDGIYLPTTSAVWTQTVNKAPASAALATSLNPSTAGTAVTFSVTVTPAAATGTVQFLDGATVIGTATIANGAGAFSTGSLTAGSHTITAVYSGDGSYLGATSAPISQTVMAVTSTAVSAGSGSIYYGQNVQLTASVTPATATGTVQFLDGGTVLGTLPLTGGAATVTATNLIAGTHSITAVYSGDANDTSSTSAVTAVTVNKSANTVSVSSSANPAASGQSLVFTVTVTPAVATGTIQLLDGAAVIGNGTLSGGATTFGTSPFTPGTHSITAVYSGDSNDSGATSAVVSQTVKATTTTALSASASTAVAGQTVKFTATVSPSVAAGSVQFLDGATVIGTVALSGGSAALSTSTLSVGTHSVTASYTGAPGYTASTSSAVSVTITAAPPSAPSNLSAAAASSSQINLSWTASATSGVTYNVYASKTSGFTPSSGNRIAAGVTTTSYSHTGLAASTTWYYLVTAQNANGESAPSNQAGATTQAAGASCHVVYTITTQWNVGFGTALTIQNTGTAPINGWRLTWTWPGNQQITESWNANYSQSGANATLTNASWNATIAAGATISGIGFNGSYSGSNPSPTAFYLNGTLCH